MVLIATTLAIIPLQTQIAEATTFNVNDFNLAGNAINCATTSCTAIPSGYNSLSPTSSSNSGEVQLTPASGGQAGFAWSKQRISLGSSFDIQAQIYLGNSDAGADGLAFVLQTASTSAGSSGGGIGYLNIAQPCFAVEFDTYQNADIANDHAALMRCSSVDNHNYFTSGTLSTSNTTAGSFDLGNIEDGYWHNVRVIWTAPVTPTGAGTFVVKFDTNHDGVDDLGETLFTTSINFYDYFGSGSVGSVYWGFTAATGGSVNVQAVRGLLYDVVPRTNAAPTITTPPTNDSVNTTAGTYSKTFSMADDSTTSGQWTFKTSSSNPARVTTTSTSATSATSATTSYTLIGSSGGTTITIEAIDADGASVTTSFTLGTPGLTPTFGAYTRTADGFTVQISNYSANYSWGGTATAGGTVAISASGLATITGVAANTSSIATITTTRSGYTTEAAASTATTSLAVQSALSLSSTSGTYGTTLKLTSSGGSGTGAVAYASGTSGCNVTNGDSLTVTSAPITCSITATKAADSNYLVSSSSATNVTFATKPITIKAVNKSATYTGSAVSVSNSYTISVGSLVGSDTFTV
ncbi:MAG: L-type lectin-domain containing protein, partial [Actinomycetes bacterium]